MKRTWRGEILQLLPIAAMFAAAAACWSRVPDRMPVHWNLHGEADGFGGKFAGLLLLPIVSLAVYGLLLLVPRFDPGRATTRPLPARTRRFAFRSACSCRRFTRPRSSWRSATG